MVYPLLHARLGTLLTQYSPEWEAGMLYGIMNRYDIALRSRALAGEDTDDTSAGFLDISWSRKE